MSTAGHALSLWPSSNEENTITDCCALLCTKTYIKGPLFCHSQCIFCWSSPPSQYYNCLPHNPCRISNSFKCICLSICFLLLRPHNCHEQIPGRHPILAGVLVEGKYLYVICYKGHSRWLGCRFALNSN